MNSLSIQFKDMHKSICWIYNYTKDCHLVNTGYGTFITRCLFIIWFHIWVRRWLSWHFICLVPDRFDFCFTFLPHSSFSVQLSSFPFLSFIISFHAHPFSFLFLFFLFQCIVPKTLHTLVVGVCIVTFFRWHFLFIQNISLSSMTKFLVFPNLQINCKACLLLSL